MITTTKSAAEKFHTRLKQCFEKKGINQREFASRIGYNQMAFSAAMAGKAIPRALTVRAIAIELGVTTDFLLGLTEYERDNHAKNDPLYQQITKLTDRDRKVAELFLTTLVQAKENEIRTNRKRAARSL